MKKALLLDNLTHLLRLYTPPDAIARFLSQLEEEPGIIQATILLHEEEAESVLAIYSRARRRSSPASLTLEDLALDFSLTEPLINQDLNGFTTAHEEALKDRGGEVRMLLPLSLRNREAGILELTFDQAFEPDTAEEDELRRVCRILAFALEYWLRSRQERLRLREAELFREAAISLSSSLTRDEVIEQVLLRLRELVPYKTCSVQLLIEEPSGDFLEIVGGNGFPNLDEIVGIRFPVGGDNPNTFVIRSRKSYFSPNITKDFKAFMEGPHRFAEIVSWMGIPMILGNKLIGMLALDQSEEEFFTLAHQRSAEVFAVQAAVAMENARHYEELKELNARLEHMAITDELTGLYNRRGFLTLGSEQLYYFRRHNIDSLLLYIDLDNFKEINDTLGHAEGDRALKAYAEILKASVRKSDLIGRMGGDEFVILSGKSEEQSRSAITERIEKRLNEYNQSNRAEYLLGATIGASSAIQPSELDLEDMIQRADRELYQWKRRGSVD